MAVYLSKMVATMAGPNITRYGNTHLISARLLGCLCMLPLYDVALDDVERP